MLQQSAITVTAHTLAAAGMACIYQRIPHQLL